MVEIIREELFGMLEEQSRGGPVVMPPVDCLTNIQLERMLDTIPPKIAREFGDRIIAVSQMAVEVEELPESDSRVQSYYTAREDLVDEMLASGLYLHRREASLVVGNFGILYRRPSASSVV